MKMEKTISSDPRVITRQQARQMTRAARAKAWMNINMSAGGYDRAKALAVPKPPPKVTPIRLGEGRNRSFDPYNKSGTGRSSTGERFTVPYSARSTITPADLKGVGKWNTLRTLRALRPGLWRANPWLNLLDLGMTIYDLGEQIGFNQWIWDLARNGLHWRFGNQYEMEACGPAGGPTTSLEGWPVCGIDLPIGPNYKVLPFGAVYQWGPRTGNYYRPYVWHQAGIKWNFDGTFPARQGFAAIGPVYSPLPGISLPLPSPSPALGNPTLQPPGLPPRKFKDPFAHNPRPPGPRMKERKARVPAPAMMALRAAYAGTEALDVLDALYDALPKDIRKQVPKTGITRNGAKIGPGKRYATPIDKAKHLYRNLDKMDLAQALQNLIANHYEDAVMGRLNGGVDKFARQFLGGARFVP